MEFDNTNKGSVWKNDKRASDRHPHFRGSINVEGKEYWLAIWKNDRKGNERAPLMKVTVTPKDQISEAQEKHSMAKANAYIEDLDDEMPF